MKMTAELFARIESGEIIEQKCWQYIKEMNGEDPEDLCRVSLTDCRRDYTLGQMYDMWERYARVFSALGMTGDQHARVGMTGSPCAETTFAFFGLNMTGASVSMIQLGDEKRLKRLKEAVEQEHITDLILTDYAIDDRFLRGVLQHKADMGIRNVIMIHVPRTGRFAFPWERMKAVDNYRQIQEVPGAVFMKDLLSKYRDHEICCAKEPVDEAAVIVHTSGTTKGVPKPVPLSDRAVNESLRRHIINNIRSLSEDKRMTTMMFMDMFAGANFMAMIAPLANRGRLIAMSTVGPGLRYFMASEHYRVTNVVLYAALIDLMILLPIRYDLSSVKAAMLVGSYSSVESKRKCKRFFRECNSDAVLFTGYGLSEAGVGLTMTTPDTKDESVGYLLPGINIKLWDEDEKCFYEPDGKAHTGVLYVSTPSLSSGRLEDRVFFELDEIDGEKYLNTNDLFRIREDGALYYLGRANKYFLNNEGVRFDAGLVERAISACEGIKSCALVPVYNKQTHDNEPVLYAETDAAGRREERIILKALRHVYIEDGMIEKSALPLRCVLTNHIPRNMGGKVDAHKITEGRVSGLTCDIEGVFENGKLKDIKLTPTWNPDCGILRGCSVLFEG